MSDGATAAALQGLRSRLRDLELDACAIRARVEEVRELIELLEHGDRRRRPQRKITIINMPGRVSGGIHETEPEPAA